MSIHYLYDRIGRTVGAVRRLAKRIYGTCYVRSPRPIQVGLAAGRFTVAHRYWPHIRRPRSFSEKIQHLKFYTNEGRLSRYADKLAVREYVRDVLGPDALIPLRAVVDDASQIMPSHLVGDVVVKTTHDTGSYLIVRGVNRPSIREVRERFCRLQKRCFGALSSEYWYSAIPPRVIVEELLVTEGGELPADYKVHVFAQKSVPHIVYQVDFDRHTNHTRCYYDENGELLDLEVSFPSCLRPFPEPAALSQLAAYACKLAAPFSYCRVDLYVCRGRVFFGEITFAPGSGFSRFRPQEADFRWGSFWRL